MLDKKPKVLFVTNLLSPFQLELACEINKVNLFDYYVAFTIPYSSKRGKHWAVNIKDKYHRHIIVANENMFLEGQSLWAAKTIVKVSPQIVISGFYKGPIYKQIVKSTKSISSNLAFWCEPPNLLYPNLIVKIYQYLILKRNLRNAQFILGIGDRAVRIYKEIFSRNVYLIPYAQDLSLHFKISENQKCENNEVTFLFSGQLVKRHNLRLIAKALVELYTQHPNKFKFVIAGYGPEEHAFWEIVERMPELKSQIIYDRDYKTWEDRVHPFFYSDVLVYPSKHSGWGLVVPEAMASGMVVITTSGVEAARYYINNGVNGIIIEPTLSQLYTQMEWCINNKNRVYEMGQKARLAHKGTADYRAKEFCDVIGNYLG